MADSEPLIAARENLDNVPESQYDALLGQEHTEQSDEEVVADSKRKGLLAYLRTRDFWTVLLLGYAILLSRPSANSSDKTNIDKPWPSSTRPAVPSPLSSKRRVHRYRPFRHSSTTPCSILYSHPLQSINMASSAGHKLRGVTGGSV
jgi:hypothetical protein